MDISTLERIDRRIQRRARVRETLDKPVTRVTSVTDVAFRCHGWCPIRHRRGMMRDETRLVGILVGTEADAAKPRPLVIVAVFDAVEA
jgi:hypothetical protein